MSDFWTTDFSSFNVSLLLSGDQKVGKTHWAMFNAPEPVFLADTEAKAGVVGAKARAAGRDVFWRQCENLADVRACVGRAYEHGQRMIRNGERPGSFVFDSASDLQVLAEEEYLIETNKDKIYPRIVYGRVYRKIDVLVDTLKRLGFNVIMLGRHKDEYNGETPTGRRVFDGYRKLPFKVDVYAKLFVDRDGNRKMQVVSNGLASVCPPDLINPGWEEFMRGVVMEPNGLAKERNEA